MTLHHICQHGTVCTFTTQDCPLPDYEKEVLIGPTLFVDGDADEFAQWIKDMIMEHCAGINHRYGYCESDGQTVWQWSGSFPL